MTLSRSLRRRATMALLGAAMGLAGCGNDTNQFQLDELRSIAADTFKGRNANTLPNPDVVIATDSKKALATTPPGERLASIRLDSVGIASVLRQVETNGQHITWAAWGTSDRKSVSTKNGMIVATRSLNKDLMSAESEAVHDLVQRRDEGTVPYTLRYIDGDFVTVEESYTCEVSRGYDKVSELGSGQVVRVLQMFSSCFSDDRQFVDLFLVDHGGRIVEMRQWVGPVLGFAYMAQLR